MITKLFEIRDRATFMPVMAVRLTPTSREECYLLARAGFGIDPASQGQYVMLWKMDGGDGQASCDSFSWNNGARTMHIAHDYIQRNFDKLETGAVIDVEFILNETVAPKESESVTA